MFVFSFFNSYTTSLKASSRERGKSPIPHIRYMYIPSQQVLLLVCLFFDCFALKKGLRF